MTEVQPVRRSAFWKELPILIVVAVVVAVVVRTFVLQTFYIPSPSMEHTLNINDRVLVNKLVYKFRAPHRGEIVVFRSPAAWRGAGAESDFIKRVIGQSGDHVVCCDVKGRISVNGRPLDESYIYRSDQGVVDPASDGQFDIVVPSGRLWVMGDHRSRSSDSRAQYLQSKDLITATIPESAVVGRAFVLFWPLGRFRILSVPETFDGVPGSPEG